MIVDLEKYQNGKVWDLINCQCDYCGIQFVRSKRNLKVGRTILQKDSCNSRECVKNKRSESQFVKHGVANAGGTPESLKKIRETTLRKYGVENAVQCPSIKKKIEDTNLKKYGSKSYLGTSQCKEQLKQYCQENYGVDNVMNIPEVKEKYRKNCELKYGVDHPRKYERYMEEFCQKFLEKHGVNYPSQMEDHLEKRQKTCVQKYGYDHPVKNLEIQEKIRNTCIEKYGKYPVNCFGKTEAEIAEYIRSFGKECSSDWTLLGGKEIDLYIKDSNLAIEYCGLFWHNEMSPSPRDKNFHYSKYKKLSDMGIKLLTIFEDEWIKKNDICKSILCANLNVTERIYARKTHVTEINKKTASDFLDDNHLQGAGRFNIACGMYHKDVLVGVITGGPHHRQGHQSFVLSRMCFKKYTQVVGGSSKMFSFFKEMTPSHEIISWSDNRWSNGNVYQKLGFKLDENLPPDYSYYKYGSYCDRRSKQSMKKSNTSCPKNITEKEWCIKNGYVRIWDCGKIRWVYQK
jgi:hypothetical protein